MKQTIFISIGGLLLLIAFLLWVYLLLFGTPQQVSEVFTNIGFNGSATPITVTPGTSAPIANVNVTGTLVQLTTRPVAGYGFVSNGSSTTKVRYAEKGTGHIFEIDLSSGQETRVSASTFLAVVEAIFAPNASAVVLRSETDQGISVQLVEIGDDTSNHTLPRTAANTAFAGQNELRYTLETDEGSTGYVYNLDTAKTATLFNVPLRDMTIAYNPNETLLYSRTAPRLFGALYRVAGTKLDRIGNGGQVFSAVAKGALAGTYVQTRVDSTNDSLQSLRLIEKSKTESILPIVAIPEKCAYDPRRTHILWCAAPLQDMRRTDQNNWYKGVTTFNDKLWEIDTNTASAVMKHDLEATAGRSIDVINLQTDNFGSVLIFRNKLDDTLWIRRNTTTQTLPVPADEELLRDSE